MQEPMLPPDETTHSFVIRLWQEMPGQWRGTIRHVQSESRMAFTRLDQAVRWIERSIETKPPARVQPLARNAANGLRTRLRAWWTSIAHYQHTPVFALAGVLAMLIIVVLLTASDVPASLAGASVGSGGSFGGVLPFLVGLVIGGLLVVVWVRSTPRR